MRPFQQRRARGWYELMEGMRTRRQPRVWSASRRRRFARLVAAITVIVTLAATAAYFLTRTHLARTTAFCTASVPGGHASLELAQAANATTIAAVGKRLGMPDHAVTVALAAALQESRLHNLPGGDRDSIGLFQQRPSQGWGTVEQLMSPTYAASAFYGALVKVPAWADLSVTDAAQRVQRSDAPAAYARWESEARVLARALTGEVPAGLTCRFEPSATIAASTSLDEAIASELGAPGPGRTASAARGWTVASWLVGHASDYDITSVSFAGRRWSASTGRWGSAPGAGSDVELRLARPST